MKRSVVRLDDESSPWAPGRCVWFFLFFTCLALLGLSVATYPLHHQQQLQRLRQQAAATGTEPVHLVVLMHGMHGHPFAMTYLGKQLEKHVAHAHSGELALYYATANWGNMFGVVSTADGVSTGGARLAQEVRQVVAAFPSVKYISFVGMSLGGLYCRFALTSILTGSGGHPPLALEPLNLVTLATPHVGVRHHLPWHYELAVKAGLAGASGWELTMLDSATTEAEDSSEPFLLRMASGQHLQALSAVRNKVLYSNVQGDVMVPYASAAIAPTGDHLQCLASAGLLDAQEASHAYISKVYRHTSSSVAACKAASGGVGDLECHHANHTMSDAAAGVCPVAGDGSRQREHTIVERLRSVGGWTNVDVDFGNGPLASFNHNRISGNFLFTNRSSVAEHLASHFIVWPRDADR